MEESLAVVTDSYKQLEDKLPNLYELALFILSDIYANCKFNSKSIHHRSHELSYFG